MSALPRRQMTFAEYFAAERLSPVEQHVLRGEVLAHRGVRRADRSWLPTAAGSGGAAYIGALDIAPGVDAVYRDPAAA